MVQKYMDIVEKVNKPRDPTDPPSVFLMDGLLQVVSL
jgi:tetratricopeptide (TPR) repeat protein